MKLLKCDVGLKDLFASISCIHLGLYAQIQRLIKRLTEAPFLALYQCFASFFIAVQVSPSSYAKTVIILIWI